MGDSLRDYFVRTKLSLAAKIMFCLAISYRPTNWVRVTGNVEQKAEGTARLLDGEEQLSFRKPGH